MDQVSRPLLIALAAAVMLAAVWLVALRPSSPETADTPSGPVSAVAKAKQAAAGSDAANRRLQTATGGESAAAGASKPAAKSPATTAPKSGDARPASLKASTKREAAVLRDMRAGKVVVMLFWNAKSADDVATRGAVRGLDRHRGKVAVHVVPVTRVGQYPAITRGVTVNQSPTTLVIDRAGRTRTIVGLTESGELGQAVGDALAGRR